MKLLMVKIYDVLNKLDARVEKEVSEYKKSMEQNDESTNNS